MTTSRGDVRHEIFGDLLGGVLGDAKVDDGKVDDALRLALLAARWPTDDVDIEDLQLTGCERFLNRVWRLAASDDETIRAMVNVVRTGETIDGDRAVSSATHVLINRISADYQRSAFRAAVAAFMEFTNMVYRYVQSPEGAHSETLAFAVDTLLTLLAPAVPHTIAELWSIRHDGDHIHTVPWPTADPAAIATVGVTMVVQVDGRVRDRIEVAADIADAAAEALALGSARVRQQLNGRQPRRVIVRAPRVVNIVTPPT